jgi:hypothetical protein
MISPRIVTIFFFIVLVGAFPQALLGQEVRSTPVYSRDGEGNFTEDRLIIISGPAIQREFRLGARVIDLIAGELPHHIEFAQNQAAYIAPHQQIEFDTIEELSLKKMKQEILSVFANGNGKLDPKTEKQLLGKLRKIQSEKELADAEVWLPHQQLIRQQVKLQFSYKHDPFATFRIQKIQEDLGLSKNQVKEIGQLSSELDAAIAKLKKNLEESIEEELDQRSKKIVDSLPNPQRQKVIEKLGDVSF